MLASFRHRSVASDGRASCCACTASNCHAHALVRADPHRASAGRLPLQFDWTSNEARECGRSQDSTGKKEAGPRTRGPKTPRSKFPFLVILSIASSRTCLRCRAAHGVAVSPEEEVTRGAKIQSRLRPRPLPSDDHLQDLFAFPLILSTTHGYVGPIQHRDHWGWRDQLW